MRKRPARIKKMNDSTASAHPSLEHRKATAVLVVGAIGVVDATEVIFPRGIARGMNTAVLEAARGISRELGATHWPPPP